MWFFGAGLGCVGSGGSCLFLGFYLVVELAEPYEVGVVGRVWVVGFVAGVGASCLRGWAL